jgi:hypothetical protein
MDYEGIMKDLLAMYHRALGYTGDFRVWYSEDRRNFAAACLIFYNDLRER